jgi:hypothetical protein
MVAHDADDPNPVVDVFDADAPVSGDCGEVDRCDASRCRLQAVTEKSLSRRISDDAEPDP